MVLDREWEKRMRKKNYVLVDARKNRVRFHALKFKLIEKECDEDVHYWKNQINALQNSENIR